MPELLLMRHAKSDHPAGMPDRERPLSRRGERSAAAIGTTISEYGAAPDLVLASPAVRATTTAQIAAEAGGWTADVREVEDLYGTGVDSVMGAISEHWAGDRVLAVGHEPTWSAAVSSLIGGGAIHMVTAAVACIEFSSQPTAGAGWLRWMLHPRLLTDAP